MMNEKLDIKLKPTVFADLDNLFQLDKEANGTTDKGTYLDKYTKLLNDPTINNQTIWVDNVIVGRVAKFERVNNVEVAYLIDRKMCGHGIATKSLKQFLAIESVRPIFARVAFDNFGSQKVLEKCGFIVIGTDKYFAKTRQAEIEEFIYKLDN